MDDITVAITTPIKPYFKKEIIRIKILRIRFIDESVIDVIS